MSSIIFDICLDPFLESAHRHIDASRGGIMRACADDIGAVLHNLLALKHVPPTFYCAAKRAGLVLNTKKCVLVVLSAPLNHTISDFIREWLRTEIPSWEGFRIAHVGKYLGFMLGHAARDVRWHDVVNKFLKCAYAISNAHAAVKTSVCLYNVYAVPLLLYKAQFASLP